MTLDTFLAELAKTPREWEVWPNGCLRLRPQPPFEHTPTACGCPITAVHDQLYPSDAVGAANEVERAEETLALGTYVVGGRDYGLGDEIMAAADNEHGHNEPMRTALLDACGVGSARGSGVYGAGG